MKRPSTSPFLRSARRRPGAGVLVGLALASATGGLACEEPEERVVAPAPPVMVAPVESVRWLERIEASGQLLARADARVAAQVTGEITSVAVDEGHAVEAGQEVVEIDRERRELEVTVARASAARARAQREEAAREHARIGRLHARGASSDAQLDEAATALDLAQASEREARAALGLAARALRDSSVAAPFAGLVSERHVDPGEYVRPGDPLFDLVTLDPVEVEFHLPEADSSRVAVGRPVVVRVAPFPDEEFHATVSVVSPTIDPDTRTLRVKGLLPNADGRLRPGLFARVDLGVAEREGVAVVPEEALLQRVDGTVVFRLVDGGRVERRQIETGATREGRVEVRSGLDADDWVVVRGQTELVDGSPVSVRRADGSPATAVSARLEDEGRDG